MEKLQEATGTTGTIDLSKSQMCDCHDPKFQLFPRKDLGVVEGIGVPRFALCLKEAPFNVYEWDVNKYVWRQGWRVEEEGRVVKDQGGNVVVDVTASVTPDTVAEMKVEESTSDTSTGDEKPSTTQRVDLRRDEFYG